MPWSRSSTTRLPTSPRREEADAEYGLEGDNILNEDVLPSDVGSGGPVIGVDGLPGNVDHAWEHVEEPFSFACSEDILGCEGGLEVDPDYANDLKGVDYQ